MRRLLVASSPGELRAAVVDRTGLVDFRLARTVGRSAVGDLYLGRVVQLMPALRAALVDIGQERPAFLSADDAAPRRGLAGVTEGATLLTQVKRDARADKAAAVTQRLRLRGPILEWTPTRPGVVAEDVARDDRERVAAQASKLLRPGEGVRLREDAAQASVEELATAVVAMRSRWNAIEERRRRAAPPACLETMPVLAGLLDELADTDVGELVVDDPAVLAEARAWLSRERPALVERLALHRGQEPLLEAAGVAETAAELLEPRLSLAGGGTLTIEPTAAATLLDVDSGALEGEAASGEAALLTVNLAAAPVIARQIRLRGLAGALVVDFIGLRERAAREQLLDAFRAALEAQAPDAQLLGWTRLGHVELTRPRRRAPLHEIVFEPRERGGYTKTATTTALEALASVARRVAAEPASAPRLRLHPAVAAVLAGEAAPAVQALETRTGRKISVVSEPGRARDTFDIDGP
jgi:Rne/Rng family ribonuclease